MKVFYSWQSDRPPNVCRHFIRQAIEEALLRIHTNLGLDESARPEIDHDTKDVPGTIDITNTILEKISNCAVFVGDITPIAKVEASGKEVANPNMLIELGYALKAVGDSRIVLVANEFYGARNPQKLPFNMRHKRGPATYNVAKDADVDTVTSQKEKLISELVTRIGTCLKAAQKTIPAIEEPWRQSRSGDASLWFEPNVGLRHQTYQGNNVDVVLQDTPRTFLRLLPSGWQNSAPKRDQLGKSKDVMVYPTSRPGGADMGPTREGYMSYAMQGNVPPRTTHALIHYFQNTGEIWSVNAAPTEVLRNNVRVLASIFVLQEWAWILGRCLRLYDHYGARAPFAVRLGGVGLEDSVWAETTAHAIDGDFELRDTIANYGLDEQLRVMAGAYNAMREAFGISAAPMSVVREHTTNFLFSG